MGGIPGTMGQHGDCVHPETTGKQDERGAPGGGQGH